MGSGLSWTKREVEYLKIAFLQGQHIKAIARDIGRTPSAVNKALSRFGLRNHKVFQIFHGIPKIATLPKKTFGKKIIPTPLQNNISVSSQTLKSKKSSFSEWVPISIVMEWLEKQKIPMLFRKGHVYPFVVSHKPMTTEQMVLYANKLRFERKEKPFMVENVTW